MKLNKMKQMKEDMGGRGNEQSGDGTFCPLQIFKKIYWRWFRFSRFITLRMDVGRDGLEDP